MVCSHKKHGEQIAYLQNAVGAVQGPFDAFLALRGLKTLSLRMEKHCSNAAKVAEYLSNHNNVSILISVSYTHLTLPTKRIV